MDKPIIGISCNFTPHQGEKGRLNLDVSYVDAVYIAGGIPQMIPVLPIYEIPHMLHLYDGIVFSGGGGLLPHVKQMHSLPGLKEQNPDRYKFEYHLIKNAINKGVPILGICRGHQMINEVMGGTLKNLDNNSHSQQALSSEASQRITIERDSRLFSCVRSEICNVNSFQNQVIHQLGHNLKASAHADDGEIEAIEGTSAPFILGVQFHPEFMFHNEQMVAIYSSLVEAAMYFKHVRN